MLNNITRINPYNEKDLNGFKWVAEYLNGQIIDENNSNGFDIDRINLINFGLVGCGLNLYYNTATGIFDLLGKKYEFIFKTKDVEYNLTNRFLLYNDCICYHKYYADINGSMSYGSSEICGYSFGYKTKIECENINFYFQTLLTINQNEPFKFQFKLVSSKEIEGEFIIKCNERYSHKVDLQLEKDLKNEFEWVVR